MPALSVTAVRAGEKEAFTFGSAVFPFVAVRRPVNITMGSVTGGGFGVAEVDGEDGVDPQAPSDTTATTRPARSRVRKWRLAIEHIDVEASRHGRR
jgi:hypothetical protein